MSLLVQAIMILPRHITAGKGCSMDPECGRHVVNTEPCPRSCVQVKVISWQLVYGHPVQVQSTAASNRGQSARERSPNRALAIMCGVVEEWRCEVDCPGCLSEGLAQPSTGPWLAVSIGSGMQCESQSARACVLRSGRICSREGGVAASKPRY
jgi:hypothetical protein